MPSSVPRIGYDAQAFLSGTGDAGKGAQLRNLVGPFLAEFLGFASVEPNRSGLPLIQEGFHGHTLWQQFSLPRSLQRHHVDTFLAPANVAPAYLSRNTDLILVLHDLILLDGFRRRDPRGRVMDAYRAWQIPGSVRRARVILTVSEHTRQEIVTRFGHKDVRVIPCTIPETWFAPKKLNNRAGHILLVTSDAPHKNATGALEGYASYAQTAGNAARPLLVVGLSRKRTRYAPRLAELGIQHKVTFLPFLTEEVLRSTYQQAAALLFPSFAEGFGIPMLEAMATGTPVVASNATSLPEVGGDAARYFDPHQPKDIARTLLAVLGSRDEQEQMAGRGVERAQNYAPARVQELVVSFWEEIARGQSR